MKKKLMAMVIAASLIGGIGTTAYASVDTVNESVIVSNVSNENTNSGEDANASNNGTSSEVNNGAVKVSIKNMGFFKFINIKFNNVVVSIQEFFNSVLGSKPNVDKDNSTGNNTEEDSTTENNGQDQNNGQDNNDVDTDGSTEVAPPMDGTTDNSQENVDKPSIDVDNSDKNNNENNTNNSGNNINNENNNSNNNVKPNVPETPQNQPSTEVKPSNPSTSVENDKFMATVEQMIFNKVNEERAKAGVSALSYNTTMQKYARIKSQDMGDNNYFSHNDLQGNLITAKMKADGVSYRAWGENIAYIGGVTDANALANQFMTNWMNSQGHRENILSTNFTSIGIGVYKVGNKVYATQEFYK